MSDLRAWSDRELDGSIADKGENSPQGRALMRERERRNRLKMFWQKDIVPWIALIFSLASLGLNMVNFYLTWRLKCMTTKAPPGTSSHEILSGATKAP